MSLNIPLSDNTFRELRDYIYEKSGIYISDTKKYLIENRLSRILREKNLTNFDDYFTMIKYSSNGSEHARLFDAVTTNETYFFREPHQLRVIAEQIIPKIAETKNGTGPIRIWSAACSSGEEPYTISMMLMENKRRPCKYELYASDLSEGVLVSAKNAVYNSYSVRNIPDLFLNKYFSGSEKSYSLSESVINSVRFMKVNLIDSSSVRALQGMDIIVCRNVLIYFDAKAKQRAIANIYDALNPGGYLIVGSSESLHNVTRAFMPGVIDKVILYQKV